MKLIFFKKQKSNNKWIKRKEKPYKYKELLLSIKNSLKKMQKGQGLVEYLILIALMGVATIGIMRTLNQTLKSRFANVIYALQGRKQKARTHPLTRETYARSDLSNFMTGASSTDEKKRSKSP